MPAGCRGRLVHAPRALPLRRRGFGAAVAAAVVLLAHSATAMPITMERKLGEEFVDQARHHMPLIHDYELVSMVREIGDKLVATLGTQPFDYEFFVVKEDSLNAFAVPGGKVFIHAGLIARAEGIEEVAGVMGHEIGHAHAHHAVRQEQKGQLASYASVLGIFLAVINPVLAQAALAAGQGQKLKYQRDFEREADFLGIEYTRKAGYDPAAMLGLLRKIYAEQQLNPTRVPPYFLSHPLTGERLSYLETALGKSEWQVDKQQTSLRFLRAQAIARGHAQTRQQAVPDYERRLALAPPAERGEALELIGVLMTHGDDYTLARKYLEEAEKAGRSVDRELGRAYLRKGNYKEAKLRLERAAKAHSDDWGVLADLAELYYQTGEYQGSVEYYERSMKLYSWLPQTRRSFARALNKAGQTGAAFYRYAEAAEFEGQKRPALDYYRRADAALPASDPLREGLAEKIEQLTKATSGPPRPPRVQREPGRRMQESPRLP